jgi:hypothetical protein
MCGQALRGPAGKRRGDVATTNRAARFPALALRALLQARPFQQAAWESATSAGLHLRIGNDRPGMNRAESLDVLRRFLGRTESFGQGFCECWVVREAIHMETEIGYRTADGCQQRIPCAVIARTTHGLIDDLRFHLDPSPLPSPRFP